MAGAGLEQAGPAELLRAGQKDETYLAWLRGAVGEVGLGLVGPQLWARHGWLVDPLTRAVYLGLTTLAACQTLGEEYCGLVMVEGGSSASPSLPRPSTRLLLLLLHTAGPVLARLALTRARALVEKQPALLPSARARLLGLLSVLQQAAPLLGQLHTVLFYLRGGQYHPAHRLAGISYLTLSSPGHQAAGTVRAFRMLGLVALANLVLGILSSCWEGSVELGLAAGKGEEGVDGPKAGGPECRLCLSEVGSGGLGSALSCGHLFCWNCIQAALAHSPACPLCRQPAQPARVIPCRNL